MKCARKILCFTVLREPKKFENHRSKVSQPHQSPAISQQQISRSFETGKRFFIEFLHVPNGHVYNYQRGTLQGARHKTDKHPTISSSVSNSKCQLSQLQS
jgi:hypothetical protein